MSFRPKVKFQPLEVISGTKKIGCRRDRMIFLFLLKKDKDLFKDIESFVMIVIMM